MKTNKNFAVILNIAGRQLCNLTTPLSYRACKTYLQLVVVFKTKEN